MGRRVLLMAASREIQDGDANPREEKKNRTGRGVALEKRLYWLCDYHQSGGASPRSSGSCVRMLTTWRSSRTDSGIKVGHTGRAGYAIQIYIFTAGGSPLPLPRLSSVALPDVRRKQGRAIGHMHVCPRSDLTLPTGKLQHELAMVHLLGRF